MAVFLPLKQKGRAVKNYEDKQSLTDQKDENKKNGRSPWQEPELTILSTENTALGNSGPGDGLSAYS